MKKLGAMGKPRSDVLASCDERAKRSRNSKFRMIYFLTLAFMWAWSNSAFAADMYKTRDSRTGCSGRIIGPIVEGDAAKFDKVFTEHSEFGNSILCLNSPGGSLVEAAEIARKISQRGYSTLVWPGDQCYSACAIIFLGGTCIAYGDAGMYENACRMLLPGAKVGFHAPFLKSVEEAQNTTFSSDEVRQLWGTSRLASSLYAEILHEFDVPADFIIKFLAVAPDDITFIDRIGLARELDILAVGKQKQDPTPNHLLQSCGLIFGDWFSGSNEHTNTDEFVSSYFSFDYGAMLVAASQSFLNYPYSTWKLCKVEYSNYKRGIYPSIFNTVGSLRVSKCDRLMLIIDDTKNMPLPRFSLNQDRSLKIDGNLFHIDECEVVEEFYGPMVNMWLLPKNKKI